MVERGRKEEGGEVPGHRRGWGRGRGQSSSGSSLAAVEGEQGLVAEHGRGRRDGRFGAALAGMQALRTEGAEQGGGGVRLGSRSGGSGERGREGGDSARGTSIKILMAHLPLVRHKYVDSNGAPPPGAPLEFCFTY